MMQGIPYVKPLNLIQRDIKGGLTVLLCPVICPVTLRQIKMDTENYEDSQVIHQSVTQSTEFCSRENSVFLRRLRTSNEEYWVT